MVFLAGEQDMYYGMCILEFSSTLTHVGINSLLYFSTYVICFYMLLCITLVQDSLNFCL